MFEFKMPSLGADMDSGTLTHWHKKPGDAVKRGDIVADVETEKGTIEVEIWTDGIISELLVQAGQKVPVGTVLAHLSSEAAVAKPQEPAAPSEKRLRVSPLARKVAAERGIDLQQVQGTGEAGAITKADIDRLQAEAPSAPMAPTVPGPGPDQGQDKFAAMRHAIAQAMSRSKRDIPHYYLQTDVNLERTLQWLDRYNSDRPLTARILPIAVFVRAVAKACESFPEMNGFWMDQGFQAASSVHVGLAISLRHGGLVAPAILDVPGKSLDVLMANILDLVERARSGRLRSSEVSAPTLTVTNLGDQGVTSVFGIIYPPQVALIGFGKVVRRPWAEGSLLGVAQQVSITLSADHRASDGHRGALFLNAVARILQEPEEV